ncbi:MAG: hypothetical protein R3C32_04125 [Chloroflexota bacterium]
MAVERMCGQGVALDANALLSDEAILRRHGRRAGMPDFVVAACERLAATCCPACGRPSLRA